ncbi:MAG TPA: hypothetical protein PK024_02015 [Methanospirillum sp.]|uniref:hypothetical protein n=1 Tax=Methanospirillum sp. TaxID=45200 RepID=UPI002C492F60|nr:hypothetical protein [Methanospirillum sp.]HOJ95604.1 hypothetical protein [Methanospirillum sp.]
MVRDTLYQCRRSLAWQSLPEPVVREKLATGDTGLSSQEAAELNNPGIVIAFVVNLEKIAGRVHKACELSKKTGNES